MGLHYYITGRGRTIKRRVDFSLPCTIVYNEWQLSAPNNTYFADFSVGCVGAINLVSPGGSTIIPAWEFDNATDTLTYGAKLYNNPATFTFVAFGSVTAYWRTGGSGPFGNPTTAEKAAGIQATSYTITGYYEEEFPATEIVDVMSYFETMEPGDTLRTTIACGAASYVDTFVQPSWDANFRPNYSLRFNLRGECYNYWNAGRGLVSGAELTAYDAASASLSNGVTAVGNAHYAGGGGFVDASGLTIASAYGGASWGTLNVDPPPAGARHIANMEGTGTSLYTLNITGALRRWLDANDQSCDVVLLVNNNDITTPANWPIVTGVTDSFSHDSYGGGYEIEGDWIQTFISGGGGGSDSGSDDNYPASPATNLTQCRAAIRPLGPGTLPSTFWANNVQHSLLARHPTKTAVMKVKNLPEKVQEGHGGTAWNVWVSGSTDDKWVTTNASASVIGSGSGSALRFTPSAALGGVSKSFGLAPPFVAHKWIGHRYWRFRIRSVGSANNELRLEFSPGVNGWFPMTTGEDGEWVERTIDFFSDPTNTTPQQCGIKPFHFYEGLSLKGENGITYEIEWIKGVRLHDALLSHVRTGITGQTFSMIHGFVDGMGSLRPVYGMYGTSIPLSTIESIKTYTDLYMPWLGWEFDILRPEPVGLFLPLSDRGDVGDSWTHSNAGGLFHDNSMYLDQDASGEGATWYHATNYNMVSAYPGAGDILSGGAYSSTILMPFSILLHGQVVGCIVPASGGVDVEEHDSPNDPSGSGSARPSGFYATGSPYVRVDMPVPPDTQVKQDAECTEDLRYWGDFLTRTPPPQPDTETLPVPLAPMQHGQRYYIRFHVTPQEGQTLAIDTLRGWLHVGTAKKIRTYHLQTLVLAFDSADHPVDSWAGLATDQRTGRLFGVGVDGGDRVVYRSYDGGVTIEEVLSVTADTAVLESDTNRGWLILLYEAGGDIQRRVSRDGGENWDTAAAVLFDGSAESGEVHSLAVDARAAGQLALIAKIGGDMKVYRSFDGGESWETAIA